MFVSGKGPERFSLQQQSTLFDKYSKPEPSAMLQALNTVYRPQTLKT